MAKAEEIKNFKWFMDTTEEMQRKCTMTHWVHNPPKGCEDAMMRYNATVACLRTQGESDRVHTKCLAYIYHFALATGAAETREREPE